MHLGGLTTLHSRKEQQRRNCGHARADGVQLGHAQWQGGAAADNGGGCWVCGCEWLLRGATIGEWGAVRSACVSGQFDALSCTARTQQEGKPNGNHGGGVLGWMGCGCSWDMRSSKVERQLTMEGPVGSMDVSGCGIHGDDTVRLLLLCFNTASLNGLVSSCGGKCVRPI